MEEIHHLKSKMIANKYLSKQKEMRLVEPIDLKNMSVAEQIMVNKINELSEVVQVLCDELMWKNARDELQNVKSVTERNDK